MVIIYRGMLYAKMFCGGILNYWPQGVRILVESKRFEIMENFYSSKTLLKLAGGGECIPPSGSATGNCYPFHCIECPNANLSNFVLWFSIWSSLIVITDEGRNPETERLRSYLVESIILYKQ